MRVFDHDQQWADFPASRADGRMGAVTETKTVAVTEADLQIPLAGTKLRM